MDTVNISALRREKLTVTNRIGEEQRQRLLEMADKCPVHRTLHSEVSVKTTLR